MNRIMNGCRLLAACLSLWAGTSIAATGVPGYPDRPITLIVPFSAGGPADTLGRVLADALASRLDTTVIVENKPGAGGNIGTAKVAKSASDGYTLLIGYVGPLAINPSLFPNIPFDSLKDFSPIALLAKNPLVLVVNPGVPAGSVKELVSLARSREQGLNYSSGGIGSANHLAAEMFKKAAAIRMVHVPYKGAAPATTALLGGQVDLMFNGLSVALPHIKAGKLKALAVTTTARLSLLPDVPTMAQAGIAPFDVSAWFGLLAPSGTPAAVLDRLEEATRDAFMSESVQRRIVATGLVPTLMPRREFSGFLQNELDRWSTVVRESGARVE
jgi:tripartite-type tricarboxylate transporter receptor subunit TctC